MLKNTIVASTTRDATRHWQTVGDLLMAHLREDQDSEVGERPPQPMYIPPPPAPEPPSLLTTVQVRGCDQIHR
jgi:hypothetical protein